MGADWTGFSPPAPNHTGPPEGGPAQPPKQQAKLCEDTKKHFVPVGEAGVRFPAADFATARAD
jgi:hypothetical protein